MLMGTNMARLLNVTVLTSGIIPSHKKILQYESHGSPKIAKKLVSAISSLRLILFIIAKVSLVKI